MSFEQQITNNDQINVKDRAQEANPNLNFIDLHNGSSHDWGQDRQPGGSAEKYLPNLSLNYGGEGTNSNHTGGSSSEASMSGAGNNANQSGANNFESSMAGAGNNAVSSENTANQALAGGQSGDANANTSHSAATGGEAIALPSISSELQTDLNNLNTAMQQFTTDLASAENSLGLGSDQTQTPTTSSDNTGSNGSASDASSNNSQSLEQQTQAVMNYLGIPGNSNSSSDSTTPSASNSAPDTTVTPQNSNTTAATTAGESSVNSAAPESTAGNSSAQLSPSNESSVASTTNTNPTNEAASTTGATSGNTSSESLIAQIAQGDPTVNQILNDASSGTNQLSAQGNAALQNYISSNYSGSGNDGQLMSQALTQAGLSASDSAALTGVLQNDLPSALPNATNNDNAAASTTGNATDGQTVASTTGATSDGQTTTNTTDTTTGGQTTSTTSDSGFQVSNGQLTVNGEVLAGVNVSSQIVQADGAQTVANDIKQQFPGINSVRLMTSPEGGAYSGDTPVQGGQSVQDVENTISAFNSDGIAVIVDNHQADANAADSADAAVQNNTEANWFGQLAQGELGNNNVMFQTLNEPTGPGDNTTDFNNAVTNEQVAAYDAIRATGSTNVVAFDEAGGGDAGPMQQNESTYTAMSNIAFDAHAYAGSNSDPVPGLQSEVNQTAGMTEASGGQIPVYIGEVGNSESGGVDAAFPQLASYVAGSGLGAEWFTYSGGDGSGDTVDNMTNPSDGTLNSYGVQVQGYIAQAVGESTAT